MHREIRLMFLVSVLLLTPRILLPQEPTRVFPTDRTRGEGKIWLEWDQSQRKGFVLGYVWGIDRGFHDGCSALAGSSSTPDAIDPSKGRDLLDNPLQHCMAKLPTFSKEASYYVAQITKFYETYPQDKDLPLRQLFAQMEDSSNNKTLEQIHSWYRTP